ncbi:hypothetical protein [Mucilaginibacter boryungensis]|uniref:Calx-beta domain-containing protein n=1 Tax=Mucilaginibacter boryungensis TaxID=768480 RepID=A0ABR9XJS6_9SPHI|nr:hypothetical protein [Mucilaginibacter boryungensis]MBE9667641.1 hypothetical protein [Mucilaginibacter boryungensis]
MEAIKRVFYLAIVILAVLSGCKTEVPEVTPIDNIIKLTLPDYKTLSDAKKVHADGATKLQLVATLPGDADAANRTVTFKCSQGTFNTTGASATQVDILAIPASDGKHFEAKTVLTLGTVSGPYTISALIKNQTQYERDTTINVPAMNVSDLLSFSIDNYAALVAGNLLKADGVTRIKLIASLPLSTLNNDLQVVFISSAGSFDVSDANKSTKTVTAVLQNPMDNHYEAWAYLTLGTTAANYTVNAQLKTKPLYTSDLIFAVQALKPTDVLKFTFSPTTGLRADGVSLLKISTAVTGIPLTHPVTLTVSDGVFQGSQTPKSVTPSLSQAGTADQFLMVGNDPKTYVLTANIADLSLSLSQTYTVLRANPDDMTLEPSSLSVDQTGSGISFNIFLKRTTGTVSPGTAVSVRAYQTNSSGGQIAVGRFTGTTNVSDISGKITMVYVADTGTFDLTKPVVIEVTGTNDAGSSVVKTFSLAVK